MHEVPPMLQSMAPQYARICPAGVGSAVPALRLQCDTACIMHSIDYLVHSHSFLSRLVLVGFKTARFPLRSQLMQMHITSERHEISSFLFNSPKLQLYITRRRLTILPSATLNTEF